jgi:exodeoxyribonuclease VII large subunit
VTTRYPPAQLLVAETLVQGPRAAPAIARALAAVAREPEVEVIILARGGGSFEDLLPFSDERVVRAVSACLVPVVSAVGHEQDTPLCDLAADVRASTPTAAGRLVVPDLEELLDSLERQRRLLQQGVCRIAERRREVIDRQAERLRTNSRLLLERRRAALEHSAGRLRALSPRATMGRGYAIVRKGAAVVTSASAVTMGDRLDVELAQGSLATRVEEVRP